LFSVQGIQRVARVEDDRQAINGDDLLGVGAFQVAEGFEVHQFAVFYRPGGGGEVGTGFFQRGKPGAGAMGGHVYRHALALAGLADDVLFVVSVRRLAVHALQTLLLHQSLDQRWAQCRANGVGTLDAQGRAVFGKGQWGGGRGEGECAEQGQQG